MLSPDTYSQMVLDRSSCCPPASPSGPVDISNPDMGAGEARHQDLLEDTDLFR